MPRNYKRKTEVANFTTESIRAARYEVLVNKKSVREVSIKLGISRTSLTRYLKGNGEVKPLGRKSVFTVQEEKVLCQRIIDCSKVFHGLCLTKTRELAYSYAISLNKKVPSTWIHGKIAGKDWLNGFRGRNPTMAFISPESNGVGRATSSNGADVKKFFNDLDAAIHEENLNSCQIFNLDEIGISTIEMSPRMYSPKDEKHSDKVGEQEMAVTLVCCISAAGHSLPPVYIFPDISFKDNVLNNVPPHSKCFSTTNGWMTTELFPKILQHFLRLMKTSKNHRTLLLLDNDASHISCETIKLAKENGVMLMAFPPHCSQRLQPFDLNVYGPFKTYFNMAAGRLISSPDGTISVDNLAKLSGQAYMHAMTPSNIRKGFAKSGINPCNSNVFDGSDMKRSVVLNDIEKCGQEKESLVENVHRENIQSEPDEFTSSGQGVRKKTLPLKCRKNDWMKISFKQHHEVFNEHD